MIKLVFCLHRLPGLSEEDFRSYWRHHHGPLVASVADTLGIRRYIQLDPLSGGPASTLADTRGAAADFDGIAELWFESEEALSESTTTPEGRRAARALLEDEKRFIDLSRSPIWLYEEHEIVS